MLNTIAKFNGVRQFTAFGQCGLSFVSRFSTSTVRNSAASGERGDDDSDGPYTKSVKLQIIFDSSAADVPYAENNPDNVNSPRVQVIFEEAVDALGFSRYKNFPLQGHVTTAEQYAKLILPNHSKTYKAVDQFKRSSVKQRETEQRRQIETVRQFGALNRYRRRANDGNADVFFKCLEKVFCTAHECPVLVRKDFVDSFPDSNLKNEQTLTVITISDNPHVSILSKDQRQPCSSADEEPCDRKADFNDYNSSVYASRSMFTNIAEEICYFIRASGFWADFVDPFSGKLFSGDFAAPVDTATSELALNRFTDLAIETAGSCQVITRCRSRADDRSDYNDSDNINCVNNSLVDRNDSPPVGNIVAEQSEISSPPTVTAADVVTSNCPMMDDSNCSASVMGLVFTSAAVDSDVVKFVLGFAANNSSKNDDCGQQAAVDGDDELKRTTAAKHDDVKRVEQNLTSTKKSHSSLNISTKIL